MSFRSPVSSGRVYHDADLNGSYDAGEELSGVTVTLTGTDDRGAAVNQVAVTASDGSYTFTNLRPSDGTGYTITETQPAGSAISRSRPGPRWGRSAG